MDPLITIAIPIYNSEKYLSECIDSVLNQSYKHFELLLINDGSTDDSLCICNYYADNDYRIKVLNNKNEGVSRARNHALDIAKGTYILYIDSDDYLLPDALSILLDNIIKTNAEISCGNFMTQEVQSYTNVKNITKEEVVEDVLLRLPTLTVWPYLINTKIIREKGIRFVEGLAYSEDTVFLDELTLHINRMALVTDYVYVHRIHPDSACNSTNYYRKAYHQLWAASCIKSIRKKHKYIKKSYTSFLKKDEGIRLGCFLYMLKRTSFSEGVSFFFKDFTKLYNSRTTICHCFVLYLYLFFKRKIKKLLIR